jgi:hypothetical protein
MNNTDSLFLGVATGIIGLGLQNLNPYEPIAITHFNSIVLGLSIAILYFVGYKCLICLMIKIYKERKNK